MLQQFRQQLLQEHILAVSLESQANLHQWHRDDPCTCLAAPHCLVRFTCGSQGRVSNSAPDMGPQNKPSYSSSMIPLLNLLAAPAIGQVTAKPGGTGAMPGTK